MAVHQPAVIVPSKLELLQAWVPQQAWLGGADASRLVRLGSYRFDDPEGEVGIETHLLGTADGQVLQVPLTYRGAPREGADSSLITTMTHSTLGDRWVYDACHDPVYVAALVTAIVTGGREADLFMDTPEGLVLQPASAQVTGSGSATAAALPGTLELRVTHERSTTAIHTGGPAGQTVILYRRPAPGTAPGLASGTAPGTAELTLTGTWPGQAAPVLLAAIAGNPPAQP